MPLEVNGLVGVTPDGQDGVYFARDQLNDVKATIYRWRPGKPVATVYAFPFYDTLDVFGPGLLYPPTLGADGALYGTAYTGEVPGDTGAVYRLTPGGQYAVLHAFTGGADGKHPVTGLVQGTGGWLYGTTTVGGAHGQGTVFRVHP